MAVYQGARRRQGETEPGDPAERGTRSSAGHVAQKFAARIVHAHDPFLGSPKMKTAPPSG